MKRILALIVSVLLLCATLAGCGTKGKLLGTWSASVDLAELMERIIGGQWVSEDYPVDSFPVTVELTFQKDNTFVLTLSAASMDAAAEKLMQQLEQQIYHNVQLQLDVLGEGMQLEDLFDITGISPELMMEEFREHFRSMGFTDTLQQDCTFRGWYKLSGDTLYLSPAEEIDKKACPNVSFTLEEGALKFTGCEALLLDKSFAAKLNDLTFTKS